MRTFIGIVLAVLIGLASCVAFSAEPSPDDLAKASAQQLWGPAGYAAKYAVADGPWLYEVGFVSVFGPPIAVGRGTSWKEAFDQANEKIKRRPASPFGDGE